jgi:hypothetical protein
MSVALLVMGIAHLLEVLLVSPSSPASRAIAAMMVGSSSSGHGGLSPHSRMPTLGISCWCPPDMSMALIIGLRCSHFSRIYSDFEKWCHSDWSHASLVPVARRSTAHPAIPPCLPLMASSTASSCDLAVVTLGLPRSVVAWVPRVQGAGCATQGAVGIEVVGTNP